MISSKNRCGLNVLEITILRISNIKLEYQAGLIKEESTSELKIYYKTYTKSTS
jgi:hypothetical protein